MITIFRWNEAFRKPGIECNVQNIDEVVTPEFIKNLRKKLKVSQRLFSQILGIGEKTVEKWEQGLNPVEGTASRLLFLLNKYDFLGNDLYEVKSIKAYIFLGFHLEKIKFDKKQVEKLTEARISVLSYSYDQESQVFSMGIGVELDYDVSKNNTFSYIAGYKINDEDAIKDLANDKNIGDYITAYDDRYWNNGDITNR